MSKTTPPEQTGTGGTTAISRAAIVAWRNALFLVFTLCGIGLASWVARVPAVRDALGVSLEQMGILIFGIAAGSIVGLLASSHVVARFGARATLTGGMITNAVGLAVAGFGATVGPSFAVAFGLTLLLGA